MCRRIFSILLVEFLFIACAIQFVPAQETPNPSARQVYQPRRGVPITSLLRPEDTQLIIVSARMNPPLSAEPPRGTSTAAWKTRLSKGVIIARVESRLSELTPDKDWIETSVQIKVLQVLKPAGLQSFNVGQELSFIEQGGSLNLEGRQIKAIVRWASEFEVGKEYLIFARALPNNELAIGPTFAYEILPGSSLRSLNKARPSDGITESSLNIVLEDIQANANVVDEK
jgi:hypothetical protein